MVWRTTLLAAAAVSVMAVTAQAQTWTGGDDLPTSPLACDATPATAEAKPYDGGSPTNAPDRKGKEIGVRRFRAVATVVLTPPQDEAVIRLNPIGLYIRDLDWTAQL